MQIYGMIKYLEGLGQNEEAPHPTDQGRTRRMVIDGG
jgi:hypothetical protein